MKKTPKTSPKSSTRPTRNDKRLYADKLAAVTGGWGSGVGNGI